MDFQPQFGTLTRCVVERGLLKERPLTLVDVGCSGGLPALFRRFEPSFRALGIDPVATECARLQAAETNPAVRYAPAFLGLPESSPFRQQRRNPEPWTGNPWERTSSARAMALLAARTAPEQHLSQLNAWPEQAAGAPAPRATLDDFVELHGFTHPDFIKIDVDGCDLEVLHSAAATFARGPVLGCVLEVNFFGSADPTDHTFHNTDRLLRSWGCELFDLTVRRCSNLALPAPFRHDGSPYETVWGRILQGDALYLRDPAGWASHPAARVELDGLQLLKLACLFELFGLPDQAAELLRDHAAAVAPHAEAAPLLHLLAHQADPRVKSHDIYLQRFLADPSSFYPSSIQRRSAST